MRPICLLLTLLLTADAAPPDTFSPTHRLMGIGVGRDDMSDDLLETRTDLMIQSQTFGIMRESQVLAGAKRITGPALQALFKSASASSGMPASIIEAIAFLESWGDPKAESPAGPRGIMQISTATAADMGLHITYATRYKLTRDKVPVKGRNGRTTYRQVTRKTPYRVLVVDERLIPERAVPAAARYLAGMEQRFGGRDWAIFAYHCGQGCVGMMQDLTRRSRGIPKDGRMTVARMFFANSPSWNRDLYEAIQSQMQRDYSPTYWFRIMRAQQLLALYRRDPAEFVHLAEEYKSPYATAPRAPHRLSLWLKKDDLVYRSGDDIRTDLGRKLVKALNRPDYLGYSLRLVSDNDHLDQASPSALGTLTYIAYETRRLFDEMNVKGQKFRPLEVSSLVEPEDFAARSKNRPEALAHCSGQVFDIDYSALPPAELQALRFVLDDLGWEGHLGFVEDGRDSLHIGCAPGSRDFFAQVFEDALGKKLADQVEGREGPQVR